MSLGKRLKLARGKLDSGLALAVVGRFLDLAGGDLSHGNRGPDHASGSLLASGPLGISDHYFGASTYPTDVFAPVEFVHGCQFPRFMIGVLSDAKIKPIGNTIIADRHWRALDKQLSHSLQNCHGFFPTLYAKDVGIEGGIR